MTNLDDRITRNREILERHPPGDTGRAVALFDLADSLNKRFSARGDIVDSDEAITLHRSALRFRPAGHSDRSLSLHHLALCLAQRYKQQATIRDLDEAITLYRVALELRPLGHSGRAATLSNLGNQLRRRIVKIGANADLDEAIDLLRSVLDLRLADHPSLSDTLHHLAFCFAKRYEKRAALPDLEEAITLYRTALELDPPDHSDRAVTLYSLAIYLRHRFVNLGTSSDLDEAIMLHRSALDLRPAGHPGRSKSLSGLRDCLGSRFEKQGAAADLDEVITLQRAILELNLPGHPDYATSLHTFLRYLRNRQQIRDSREDLDECISLGRAILALRGHGRSTRVTYLLNLASDLYSRFRQAGKITDLEEAITHGQTLLDLHPQGDPGRADSLNTLLIYLEEMLNKSDRGDLYKVVSLARETLALCPAGHSDYPSTLRTLANSLSAKSQRNGDLTDLEESITLRRNVLEPCPAGHRHHASSLRELSLCLSDRFEQRAMTSDIEEAIMLARRALELQPRGHPDHALYLDNLIFCVQRRHQKLNATTDAEELRWTVLELRTPGCLDQARSFQHLASTLYLRFQRLGSTTDLKEAVSLARAVLGLCPPGHPNIAMPLHDLVIYIGDMVNKGDLDVDEDEMVNFTRVVLKHCPPGHSDHISSLRTLATSLRRRFHKQDAIEDLNEAIAPMHSAVDICLSGNVARAASLHELALCLSVRFKKLATTADLDNAIEFERAALDLHPPGHPDHAESRNCLTDFHQLKIKERGAISPPARLTCPTSSLQMKDLVRGITFEVLKAFPPRLLDTRTGSLCNRDSQIRHFEESQDYHQLLSSASAVDNLLPTSHIYEAVFTYFRYAALSHRWGRSEPLLGDIEGRVIYDLIHTDGLSKLQSFCLTCYKRGYLWAWSDTCCIDKDSSAELQEAIGSMFLWYRQLALTMVYLADVPDSGTLTSSEWFKRGWTLQELLAPHTILFFTRDWSLYKDCTSLNHKESDIILSELEQATGITLRYLTDFHPGVDDARSRLQWASKRCTTRPEDIAYSLFGIFNVYMTVRYGESVEIALGRLLKEVISSSGGTSILDWVEQSSSFHSCFPATITPYQIPPSQSSFADLTALSSTRSIRKLLIHISARKVHQALSNLPRTQFVDPTLYRSSYQNHSGGSQYCNSRPPNSGRRVRTYQNCTIRESRKHIEERSPIHPDPPLALQFP